MKGKEILVVVGSLTSEDVHGRSSGRRVAEALRERGATVDTVHSSAYTEIAHRLISNPPDVVVPVGFGVPTESGGIHTLSKMLGVPCAGPNALAGSIMLDKGMLESLVATTCSDLGVRPPVGISVPCNFSTELVTMMLDGSSGPFVVKPNFGGSSDNLYVAMTAIEAARLAVEVAGNEGRVLIQQLEAPILAEVSATVLDEPDGPRYLPLVQIDREDTVVFGPEQKFGPTASQRHRIPADLPSEICERIRDAVLRLQNRLGAVGLTRWDALVLPDEQIVLLEANAIPGLLPSSIAVDAAAAGGISFPQLCEAYAASAFLPRPEPNVWPTRLEGERDAST